MPPAACAATSSASRPTTAFGSNCRRTTCREDASSTGTASSLTSDIAGVLGSARIFDLEQLRYAGAPSHPAHAPGFNYFLHRHHAPGAPEARTGASGIVVMPEHSGTHIDALAHQAENLTLHGGVHVDGVQTSAGIRVPALQPKTPHRGGGGL